MSPEHAVPERSSGTGTLQRRTLLASVGVGAAGLVAGCTADEGEGETRELVVENTTSDRARIAVRADDEDGESLFSRVYVLEPDHLDESAGVESDPATVTAFVPGSAATTWEYAPDVDCPGADIGVALTEDGIEPFYTC